MSSLSRAANLKNAQPVKIMNGLYRTTLAYNEQIMMCKFSAQKDTIINIHTHLASQSGYILKGAVEIFNDDGLNKVINDEESFTINCQTPHGMKFLEDTELIEIFTPMRNEFL